MNILGTEYQLIESDDIIKQNADGVCMEYDKQIKIRPLENMLNPDDSKLTKKKRYNEVLRHEVIHAFLVNQGWIIIQVMKGWLTGLRFSFRSWLSCSVNRDV